MTSPRDRAVEILARAAEMNPVAMIHYDDVIPASKALRAVREALAQGAAFPHESCEREIEAQVELRKKAERERDDALRREVAIYGDLLDARAEIHWLRCQLVGEGKPR